MLKERMKAIYHDLRWYTSGRGAYQHMLEITEKRPLDINIELVTSCPLKCCFCCNRKIKREFSYMNMDLFKKITKEYIELGGGGYGLSTMNSDVFVDPLLLKRLDYLKSMKDSLYIVMTNPLVALSRYTDDEVRFILETIDYLQVSVEGTNKEDYFIMTGINGFEDFYNNLYRVKKILEEYSIPLRLELSFRTYDLEHLRKEPLYKKIQEDFTVVQAIDTYFDWFGKIKPEDLPDGAKISCSNNINEVYDCAASYSSLAIHTDGSVVGCGCIDWNGDYIVGDCNTTKLEDVWCSDKAVQFRKAFSEGNIPDICKRCGLYSSLKSAYGRADLRRYTPNNGIYYAYP